MRLLQLIGSRLLDLEALERLGELSLNSGLVLALDLHSDVGGGDCERGRQRGFDGRARERNALVDSTVEM